MNVPHIRRRWLAIGIVVVLVIAIFRLLDQPVTLASYRVIDPSTLIVTGYGSRTARANLSDLVETESTVTVRVDAFTFEPFPGTAAGYAIDVEVRLSEPLGRRIVVDGSTGQEVPESTE
jgi:hypothetical protein